MKKGVGSGSRAGSGFISQRYGSGDTDPQHCFPGFTNTYSMILVFLISYVSNVNL
jgi:hypothetical protein